MMLFFRRAFALLLCLCLLPVSAALALTPEVALYCSEQGSAVAVGTELSFTLVGTNTAAVRLMIVRPDSTQLFLDGAQCVYTPDMPGTYVFVAYGANHTDPAAPGFERCMSRMITLEAEGQAIAAQPVEMQLEMLAGDQWLPLEGQMTDSLLPTLRLCAQALPEAAFLHLEVEGGGASLTLAEGTAAQFGQYGSDGSYTCFIQPDLSALVREEWYDAPVALRITAEANGQRHTAAASFLVSNYTDEMCYVSRFAEPDSRFYSADVRDALDRWLDMSERDVYTRRNSGYLMLEEEWQHQQGLGYSLGYGYTATAKVLLETVSNLGLNGVEWVVSDMMAKAKFPNAGKSARIYYQNLANFYGEYVSTLVERTMQLEAGQEKLYSSMSEWTKFIDDEADLVMGMQQSPLGDIGCFVPENYQVGNDVVYRITGHGEGMREMLQNQFPLENITYTCLGPEGSNMTVQLTMEQMLAPVRDGYAVVIDASAIQNEIPGFRAIDLITTDASLSRIKSVTNTDAADDLVYSVTRAHCDYLTYRMSRSYRKLPAGTREDIEAFARQAGSAVELASFATEGLSAVSQLHRQSAAQTAILCMLSSVTDEYIALLDEWCEQLPADAPNRQDQLDALRAIRQDIIDMRDGAVRDVQAATIAFSGDECSKFLVDVVKELSDKAGLGEVVKGALQKASAKLTAKYGSKAASVLGQVKLPKGGLLVISIGSFVMNLISADYFDFHDGVKTIYQLKKSLTDTVSARLTDYERQPTHKKALTVIAGLNLLKGAKKTGEQLVETSYLEDFYHMQDMDDIPEVRAVVWYEWMQTRGTEQLSLWDKVVPVTAVFEERRQPGKLSATVVLHGYHLQRTGDSAVYNGVELQPLPLRFQNLPERKTVSKADSEETAWRTGGLTHVEQPRSLYRETYYLYRSDGMEMLLSPKQYDACSSAMREINRLMATYTDEPIKWYESSERKKEQQIQQRLLWTKLTGRYIESFAMFDPEHNERR